MGYICATYKTNQSNKHWATVWSHSQQELRTTSVTLNSDLLNSKQCSYKFNRGRHKLFQEVFQNIILPAKYQFPSKLIFKNGQPASKIRLSEGKIRLDLPNRQPLTLNVRGPSYLGLTRSISWLLMPWLLTSPGHQQPWYWLHRICRSLSYLRKNFKYLCHINVEEWHKM